jgi:hypothetical protein
MQVSGRGDDDGSAGDGVVDGSAEEAVAIGALPLVIALVQAAAQGDDVRAAVERFVDTLRQVGGVGDSVGSRGFDVDQIDVGGDAAIVRMAACDDSGAEGAVPARVVDVFFAGRHSVCNPQERMMEINS